MFLLLDGIKGESTDSKHKGEIDIVSFTFGVSQTGTSSVGGGGGAGKANYTDISFVKRADKSSPMLMQNCAAGTHIKSALLTVRKAGGTQQEYYKIKLTDLLVANFQNNGSGHDEVPMESLSLNFSTISFEYYEQLATGGLGGQTLAGWDIKQNKKV
jgi:type VI secretion system secreted protein Hcp